MSSFLRNLYRQGRAYLSTALFYIFRIFPLQNKIVITTFRGKKYGDNSQYILEKLHEIDPKIRIIWQTDTKFGTSRKCVGCPALQTSNKC